VPTPKLGSLRPVDWMIWAHYLGLIHQARGGPPCLADCFRQRSEIFIIFYIIHMDELPAAWRSNARRVVLT
jgi:hypothetical protein